MLTKLCVASASILGCQKAEVFSDQSSNLQAEAEYAAWAKRAEADHATWAARQPRPPLEVANRIERLLEQATMGARCGGRGFAVARAEKQNPFSVHSPASTMFHRNFLTPA